MIAEVAGRLIVDPEIKTTKSGKEFAKITVADNYYAGQKRSQYVNIILFGKKGEFAKNYLRKGSVIVCTGLFINKRFTTSDGRNVSFWYMSGEHIKNFKITNKEKEYLQKEEEQILAETRIPPEISENMEDSENKEDTECKEENEMIENKEMEEKVQEEEEKEVNHD